MKKTHERYTRAEIRLDQVKELVAQDMTWQEIAEKLGCTVIAVRNLGGRKDIRLTAKGRARASERKPWSPEHRRRLAEAASQASANAPQRSQDYSPPVRKPGDDERLAELIAQGQALAGKGKRIERAEPEYVERRFLTRSAEHCWPSVSTAA